MLCALLPQIIPFLTLTLVRTWYSVRPKMIVRDQMLIDFVDVEIFWHTKLFGKNFYINEINKHLISDREVG